MTNPFAAMGIGTAPATPADSGELFGTITSGQQRSGIRCVIAGSEKMGKTTFACSAPRPLLIPFELGAGFMNVARTDIPKSFPQVMRLLHEIEERAKAGQFPYMSIIVDTGTALERLIDLQTIADDPQSGNKRLTMETAHGGYGKAYAHSNMLFDQFTKICDRLAYFGGINIIVTCHVFAARAIDPQHGEFDTWDLLLHSPKDQKKYGKREFITQWADLVGFLYEPFFISTGDGETVKKATTLGKGRVLGISRTPNYVAGNRYGMNGEIPIPNPMMTPHPYNCGWNHLANAIQAATGLDYFNRDAL